MAKPIYSFKLKDTGLQFFYLHNTFFELPHTIPMDIVTFILFNGSKGDEFTRVFHDVYPALIENGTTLKDWSYDHLDGNVRQHTEHFAASVERNTSSRLLEIADRVCILFETERNFPTFKKKLNNLLKTISPHLPRPLEYYESWHSTASALFKSNLREHDYLQKLLQPEYDEHGHTVVPDFLLNLIHRNLIPLNSVPHVYRHNSKIEQIFKLYAAEQLLPQTHCDEVKINEEFSWVSFPMEGPLLRRFTELCLHSDYGVQDEIRRQLEEIQKPIHELDDERLFELNDFSRKGDHLINYSMARGLNKLPWKYISIRESTELCFLVEYHYNALKLFENSTGRELAEDVFNEVLRISGALFEANPSGYFNDHHIWRYHKIGNRVEYVQPSAKMTRYIDSYPSSFALIDGDNKYFYYSGWFNFKNEPLSPLCFTAAGPFSEGLAPVCLNGKWGFVDEQFNLVIPAIYGHVHAFNSGYAKVFLLDKEFRGERGEWVELPIHEDLGEEFVLYKTSGALLRKFSGYPNKVKLPLRVLSDKAWQKNRIELNYFGSSEGEDLDRRLGRYILIDKAGKVVFRNLDRFTFDLTPEGQILHKQKEVIESEEKYTHFLKRKASSRKHAISASEINEYRDKLQKHECEIYDIPDALLANASFMFEVFNNGWINYTDLPLNYKLERTFALAELKRSANFGENLPASVREKYLSEYKMIVAQQLIDALVANLSAFVLVGIDWPERIQYLEFYTGKQNEMHHYTLQAVKPLTVAEILQEIGKSFIQLREENRLFQDIFYTCENVYHKLADSEKFIVPEFTTCIITKRLANSEISVWGISDRLFKLQIMHELYQDEYEHAIFHQANAQGDFIENCEYFITNNPPQAEESVSEYSDRIKCFLLERGFTEQALLQVPIYKETILPVLDPIDQLPIAPTLNIDLGSSLLEDDDLPF